MPAEASGAGWVYDTETFPITLPGGAGQASLVLSLPRGFRWTLIAAKIVTKVVAAGAGATRVINIRRGSATGTIVATATYTLAGGATVGVVQDVPVTGGSHEFLDGDNLTIESPAAGAVAFTAGEIVVVLTSRKRVQQRN